MKKWQQSQQTQNQFGTSRFDPQLVLEEQVLMGHWKNIIRRYAFESPIYSSVLEPMVGFHNWRLCYYHEIYLYILYITYTCNYVERPSLWPLHTLTIKSQSTRSFIHCISWINAKLKVRSRYIIWKKLLRQNWISTALYVFPHFEWTAGGREVNPVYHWCGFWRHRQWRYIYSIHFDGTRKGDEIFGAANAAW